MKRFCLTTALLMAAFCSNGLAQAIPHSVIAVPLVYSDDTTPILAADLHFDAWISTRPAESTNEDTPGNYVWDDAVGAGILVECSLFPTPWEPGEILAIDVTGDGSNYWGAESFVLWCVLSQDNPQYMTGDLNSMNQLHGVSFVPITYSDMTTAVLPEDLHFTAYISNRPWDQLHENSLPGSVTVQPFGTTLIVECGLFEAPWDHGEELVIEVLGDGSNYTGPETFTVTHDLGSSTLVWLTRLNPGR